MADKPAFSQASRLAGRLWWVARRWKSGGHPSLLCCAVIRRPSGSSGLFELYVPLIIHLGCSALGQAHKDLIYSLAGNERTWRCWAGSRDCWPCCQEIELMDGLQCHSTPTATPPFSTEHPFLTHPYLSSYPALLYSSGLNKSFYGRSVGAEMYSCFILSSVCSYTCSRLQTVVVICILPRHALKHL